MLLWMIFGFGADIRIRTCCSLISQFVARPVFDKAQIAALDKNVKYSYDLSNKKYLPGTCDILLRPDNRVLSSVFRLYWSE